MPLSRNPLLSDRQGFDRRWYAANLEQVYAPSSGVETVQAWSDVISNRGGTGGELQITSGRHCYENFVYNPGTRFVIDTTGLRDFGVDSSLGYYIGAGYGNWDMYRMFNNVYGVTLPAGSCYSVGLGGHITGGGYGLLSRMAGLTVDYVSAVDIVVQSGNSQPELITASANQNSDLYWAVRGGGGGNFGVITRYYFDNPPPSPSTMYSTAITIDWSDITNAEVLGQLLKIFSDYCSDQSDLNLWKQFAVFHANHKAAGSMSIVFYLFDAPDQGLVGSDYQASLTDQITDIRRKISNVVKIREEPGKIIGHPWHGDTSSLIGDTASSLRRFTYLEGVQNANGSGPNRFGKYKSAYMRKAFTPQMVDAMFAGLTETPSLSQHLQLDMSQSLVQIDSYGCAINQVASDATAIAQRDSIMKLQFQTYWDNPMPVGEDNPLQAAGHLAWINKMYTLMYSKTGGFPNPQQDPGGTVDGCYYNYCDSDLGTNAPPGNGNMGIDFAMDLYFKQNFNTNIDPSKNLQIIKRKYNDHNWFASAQSIPV